MAQQFRALPALAEDQGLVTSAHINHLEFQFQGILCPLASMGPYMHGVHKK